MPANVDMPKPQPSKEKKPHYCISLELCWSQKDYLMEAVCMVGQYLNKWREEEWFLRYSETCIKRPHVGPKKWPLNSYRWSLYEGQNQ